MSEYAAALAEIIALAIAIAVSPLPVSAALMVLTSSGGRRLGVLFTIGWAGGLLLGITLASLGGAVLPDGSVGGRDPYPIVPTLAGMLLVGLGLAQWRRAGRREPDAPPPKWITALDNLTPVRVALAGAILAILKPKNIAVLIASGIIVGRLPLTLGETAGFLAVFVLIASSTVVAPVLVYLLGGERVRSGIDIVRTWVVTNMSRISAVVLVLVGAVLFAIGAIDLLS